MLPPKRNHSHCLLDRHKQKAVTLQPNMTNVPLYIPKIKKDTGASPRKFKTEYNTCSKQIPRKEGHTSSSTAKMSVKERHLNHQGKMKSPEIQRGGWHVL